MNQLVIGILALAALGCSGAMAWTLTPYATLREIQNAVRSHDAAGLAQYVDWQALRVYTADRAKQCIASVLGTPESGTKAATLRGMVHAISGATIDAVVQQAVSPSVLLPLLEGQAGAASATPQTESTARQSTIDWSIAWQSWTRVNLLIVSNPTADRTIEVSLRRDGLDWKLDRIPFECPKVPK